MRISAAFDVTYRGSGRPWDPENLRDRLITKHLCRRLHQQTPTDRPTDWQLNDTRYLFLCAAKIASFLTLDTRAAGVRHPPAHSVSGFLLSDSAARRGVVKVTTDCLPFTLHCNRQRQKPRFLQLAVWASGNRCGATGHTQCVFYSLFDFGIFERLYHHRHHLRLLEVDTRNLYLSRLN